LFFIPQSVRTPIGKEDVVGELFGTVRHEHWVGWQHIVRSNWPSGQLTLTEIKSKKSSVRNHYLFFQDENAQLTGGY
jgi:hypothetical protein